MHLPIHKTYLFLSISFLPLALGLNSTRDTPWGKSRISIPKEGTSETPEVSNIPIPNARKCEEILSEICPPTKPGCEGTTIYRTSANQDSWHPVVSVKNGVSRIQQPKVLSCLELVRDGKLNVNDALETMKELGLNDVDDVMDQVQSEEVPGGLLNIGGLEETSTGDGMDLGMIMHLLGALGLQMPPDDNGDDSAMGDGLGELGGMLKMLAPLGGSIEEGPSKNETAEEQDPEPTFEEILAVMQTYEKSGNSEPGQQKEALVKDESDTMEWIYQNDPAAANGDLAPILEALKASGMATMETVGAEPAMAIVEPGEEENTTGLEADSEIDEDEWVLPGVIHGTVPEDEWAAYGGEKEIES